MRQIFVPILILALFAGLIVPLPSSVVDYLLVFNVTIATLLLVSSLYINDPLKLSALPSFLLLATLFRLTLNLSTTRLILSSGDPGELIQAFGQIVVQDNLVVGFVIFLIITFIQLIVISKGSERVAEVSARFTLDALPGKQMSIDADMRSGLIDFKDARRKRKDIQTESRFYGALDGSMKFVKGDAIAGLVITGVNIIGGILIGVFYNGLAIKTALMHYTLLTIGDGLLSQIPALLTSVAAGIVVTRVVKSEGSNLGVELFQQLLSVKPVKIIIGLTCLMLSLVPGLPTLPLILAGGFLLFLVKFSFQEQERVTDLNEQFIPKIPEKISIKIGKEFIKNFKSQQEFQATIENVRRKVFEQTGIILTVPFFDFTSDEKLGFSIQIRESLVIQKDFHQETTLKSFASDLESVVLLNKIDLIDDQQTRLILDNLERIAPELIANVVPDIISLTKLTKILKKLVSEDLSIINMDLILQAISENSIYVDRERKLLELIRIALKRQITEQFAKQKSLNVLTIDTEIDLDFYNAEIDGTQFNVEYLNRIIEGIKIASLKNNDFVLICSSSSRLIIKECLIYHNCFISVVAYEEINRDVKIKSIYKITIQKKEKNNKNNYQLLEEYN